MIRISKETFMARKDGKTPMASWLTRINESGSDLILRVYWSVGSDTWDDNFDYVSRDYGKTWSEPTLSHTNEPVEGGHMTYTEGAAVYHPKRDKLIIITDYYRQYGPGCWDNDNKLLHIVVSRPNDILTAEPLVTSFGGDNERVLSFCHPFIDSKDRIIFPFIQGKQDDDGSMFKRGFSRNKDFPNHVNNYGETGVLVGRFNSEDKVDWRLGKAMPFDVEMSSRGMSEPTVIELETGRFAMICRGSNDLYPGVQWGPNPGYKWLSYSEDACETWSKCEPLGCDDGSVFESSATGSYAFRSIKNGKLYWIGNMCFDGKLAEGSFPRQPLYIAELTEDPVAIKKETVAIIDQAKPGENKQLQLSNFRCHQDYETGDVMLYMNRFAERGGYEDLGWHDTDLYRYRITLD